jgi:hypothetical protein
MPFLISTGTGLLLGFFCRFVGPRKIRIFEPLASYLTPDSHVGAIKTYVRLVGLVKAEREVAELLSHISRLGNNEAHQFTLSRFIRSGGVSSPTARSHDAQSFRTAAGAGRAIRPDAIIIRCPAFQTGNNEIGYVADVQITVTTDVAIERRAG